MSSFSLNEIIEFAVQIEQNGYAFYDNAINRKDLTENSRKLLTHLRDEEIAHEITFKNMRDEIALNEIDNSVDWDTVSDYLRNIIESHIFFKKEASINIAVNSKNEKEIFLNAVSFENDTLRFFQSLEKEIKSERPKKIIRHIIDEENSHVKKLQEYYDKL